MDLRSASTVFFGAWLAASAIGEAGERISYDKQIQPILSSKCFACHGPDDSSRKAGLRLDQAPTAAEVEKGKSPVVRGNPEHSELFRRITSADPAERMPPPEADEALTAEEIALIRAWISQGAEWSAHWAFMPPQRPAVPTVTNAAWPRNAIDAFVLQRLEKEGLAPTAEANRETLLRRLSLDLTGLVPSLEDIARVNANSNQNWYEEEVERLLASPHYGERWARHWMDAAQYADSDGFEKDKPRFVWAWRDWVIKSFNEGVPFDQFVIQQVAGDMLPNATQDTVTATGFLRNSMINEEGGIDPEQFRMEAQFNRMDIIGRSVLGLTINCAQCHTHKYDPLSHSEYYAMMAFLNNAHEACETVYSSAELKQRDTILSLVRDIENDIKTANPDWKSRMAAWEASVKAIPQPAWEVLRFEFDDTSAGGQKMMLQEDGSYLAQGYAPTQFHPKMTAKTTLKRITAVRLELLPDPNLPRGGPGRSIYGAGALSEFDFRHAPADTPIADYDKWTPIKVASAIADINPPTRAVGAEFPLRDQRKRVTGPIEMAIDGNNETAWTTDIDPVRRNQARYAIFKLAEPLTVPEGAALAFRLSQLHGGWNSDDNQNNNLGRIRVSVTDSEVLPDKAVPLTVQAAVAKAPALRTEVEQDLIFTEWRASQPDFSGHTARIDALLFGAPSGTTQLALRERELRRPTHRLERGDFLSPAEEVKPGVPAFLHALNTDGSPDRLDFAKWLVSRESPTTARAFVNRVWQQYFGEGITSTSSDLGTQAEAPTHPELLDWLAVEFMESGWDVKHLHR
ncbi:MAG TPA: PSD1 and planctomycete cytochrome C domain-containing protein, partial [Candidatus Hydrogenedentes bacterium]|nr:PSD1 and planctomycete cytochrome C domain-containing protein [Candidatus Hydrogenedentota bacterium]